MGPFLYDELWKLGPCNYPMIRTIIAERGWTVQTVPFKGMRYILNSSANALAPKLLGAYECELHVSSSALWPTRLIGRSTLAPPRVIEPLVSRSDLADLNGVADRVQIHGLCTPTDLAAPAPVLIISDREGVELELLDRVRVPALASCPMLAVELRDFVDARISKTLVDRFSATHQIDIVSSQKRTSDFLCSQRSSTISQRWRSKSRGDM